jgi:two-component system cell cycle response regulator
MAGEADLKIMARKIGKLPTLPGVAVKILQAMQKEAPSIKEISDIISTDAPLSAKVLQVVNSPFYGLTNKISSVSHAMTYLGLNTVKNLALSFSLMHHLRKKNQYSLNYVQFWKDSLVGAVSAKLVAERIDRKHGENAFFLGLLQDIGVIILADSLPDSYPAVYQEASSGGRALHEVESEVIGTNHMVVGQYVADCWGFPKALSAPIGAHHAPEQLETAAEEVQLLARVLNLSSLFVELFNGIGTPEVCGRIDRALESLSLLSSIDRVKLTENIFDNIKNIIPVFEMEIDEEKCIEIIEETRNEQVKLSGDLLEQVHNQAKDLNELKIKANIDSLTQLDNRTRLAENLQREIARASRYKSALSVAMADIDHFKSINDFFGHLTGDFVLKCVSARLKQELRTSDMVARYGGEEFAFILPMTELDDAFAAVERIRKAIAGMKIEYEGKPISVTMSFGVAALGSQPMEMDGLIKMADEALYEAKRTGRNRSCKFKSLEPERLNAPTVVVIDDEEVVLVTVTKMLQRLGYSVVGISSGQEAIKMFHSKPKIAMVIMDLVMPDIAPEQLLKVIREMGAGIKILLSSGYCPTTVSNSELLNKTDGFLQKPYNLSELSEILSTSLG